MKVKDKIKHAFACKYTPKSSVCTETIEGDKSWPASEVTWVCRVCGKTKVTSERGHVEPRGSTV
jgi:rubredoxin